MSEYNENKLDNFIIQLKTLYEKLNSNENDIRKILLQWEDVNYNLPKKYDIENTLYPSLLDKDFTKKISEKKEFYDTRYPQQLKKDDDILFKLNNVCMPREFELLPQQKFVRNFLSYHTPYNALLLYHGLGTGKTCSAISMSEEYRDNLKQIGIKKRIIIIATPNVQEEFKRQIFDETKLKEVNGVWNLNACTGNKLLQEVNPTNVKGLSRDKLIRYIKKIIRDSYVFMGYIEFANYIDKVFEKGGTDEKKQNKALQNEFSNRLIIIDEVHNIRITEDNPNKRIATNLLKIAELTKNMKLLLLSATPMFNNYKEIIWLLNLLNVNDGRPTIEFTDIFNKDGTFKINKKGREIGREIFEMKLNAYISYVKGQNPFEFPYRIYPSVWMKSNELVLKNPYPKKQLNGMKIIQPIEFLDIVYNKIGEYQETVYDKMKEQLKEKFNEIEDEELEMGMGYSQIQPAIQILNMTYPLLDNTRESSDKINLEEYYGSMGLKNTMKYNKEKRGFEYRKDVEEKYGRFFQYDKIGKYSSKIKHILENIRNSKGVVMIYSQYLDGGIVPICLALEEMGFGRYGSSNLLKEKRNIIDYKTMKTKEEHPKTKAFIPAKYAIITGDTLLSPNNNDEIKACVNPENINGRKIKVVLISKAGSEGIDFKFIRQIHIMEPWYNMNRIEQVFGRAVRYCSHGLLPIEERNVMMFLHGTKLKNKNEEAIDLYLYRFAEKKAIQIGIITRIMKEQAVDCLLNKPINSLTEDEFNNVKQSSIEIELSNGKKTMYQLGDKPYSEICDYQEKCSFDCKPNNKINEEKINMNSYNIKFLENNSNVLMKKVKQLFTERYYYYKDQIIEKINYRDNYSLIQINYVLDKLVNDNFEIVEDLLGRLGNVINIDDIYLFQPLELQGIKTSRYENVIPIDYKVRRVEVNTKEYAEKEESEKIISSYDEIINNLQKNINVIENYNENFEKQDGIKKWYINLSNLIKKDEFYLKEGNNKKQFGEKIKIPYFVWVYAIQHFIDKLKITEILELYNSIWWKKNLTEIEKIIKEYLKKNILKSNDLEGLLIRDDDNIMNLYIKDNDNKIWKEATPIEQMDMKDEIKKRIQEIIENMNLTMGFIVPFKEKEIIFKVKDMKDKRSKGARCDQAAKKITLKQLTMFFTDEEMETIQRLKIDELCVIQEMYFRLFNDKESKRWFLNRIESEMINIENITL